jgi:hypothetical protein
MAIFADKACHRGAQQLTLAFSALLRNGLPTSRFANEASD